MNVTRHDWRAMIAMLLIAGGFGVAVANDVSVDALRVVVGALAAAVGVALLL